MQLRMCKCFFKTLAFDFFTQDKQVFLWKKGSRMKLTNGVSSGPVVYASVRSADVINVSILIVIAIILPF